MSHKLRKELVMQYIQAIREQEAKESQLYNALTALHPDNYLISMITPALSQWHTDVLTMLVGEAGVDYINWYLYEDSKDITINDVQYTITDENFYDLLLK